MKIADALHDFLYDQKFFVTFFENNVHVYRYLELCEIMSTKIVLKMTNFYLTITGTDLLIKKMNCDELLINGHINNIGIGNDK